MREGKRPLGDALTQIHRSVRVADLDVVPYAGVRLYAEGVYRRDSSKASEVKAKSLNRLEAGDVVYNRMWATKASFGIAGEDVNGCLVTNDFPIFEADAAVTSTDYIGLIFHTPEFQSDASERSTGTTERRRLKEAAFLGIEVPLPPLPVQHRIVDLIASLDETIEAADESAVALGVARNDLLSELLQAKDSSDGWLETTLGGVAANVSASLAAGVSDDTPYVPLDRMVSGSPTVHEYGVSSETISATTRFQDGDVLFSKLRPYLNKVAVADREGCCTGEILVWRTLDPNILEGMYLSLILRDRRAIDYAVVMSSGTKMPRTSASQMRQFTVSIPPLEEQGRIVDLVGSLDEELDAAKALALSLRALRVELLAACLSGEHEIPSGYDQVIGVG
jgi:type I restriction enzyme S subunit